LVRLHFDYVHYFIKLVYIITLRKETETAKVVAYSILMKKIQVFKPGLKNLPPQKKMIVSKEVFSNKKSSDYLVNSKPIIIIKNTQVSNNPTKKSIKVLKKSTEIINPIIIKTIPIIPIVDVIKNLFFILYTLQEQCFIINIFGRLSKLKNKKSSDYLLRFLYIFIIIYPIIRITKHPVNP
jgi:hypothetical protein